MIARNLPLSAVSEDDRDGVNNVGKILDTGDGHPAARSRRSQPMSAMKKTHYRVSWGRAMGRKDVIRSSIGGYPILPATEGWPVCCEDGCNQPMSLFLQFDVEDGMGLSFENGSTLSVFQCLRHDDPFEELDTQFPGIPHNRLPQNYWDHRNYAMFFTAPGEQRQSTQCEPFVLYSKLVLECEPEPDARSAAAMNFRDIKIGGSPFWIQQPRLWRCSCGSDMEFLCSLPGNLEYPRTAGSPRQTNGRQDSHFLFLGLFTYVFACRARCDPRAVVAVRQN
jgi:hypothetical protein